MNRNQGLLSQGIGPHGVCTTLQTQHWFFTRAPQVARIVVLADDNPELVSFGRHETIVFIFIEERQEIIGRQLILIVFRYFDIKLRCDFLSWFNKAKLLIRLSESFVVYDELKRDLLESGLQWVVFFLEDIAIVRVELWIGKIDQDPIVDVPPKSVHDTSKLAAVVHVNHFRSLARVDHVLDVLIKQVGLQILVHRRLRPVALLHGQREVEDLLQYPRDGLLAYQVFALPRTAASQESLFVQPCSIKLNLRNNWLRFLATIGGFRFEGTISKRHNDFLSALRIQLDISWIPS